MGLGGGDRLFVVVDIVWLYKPNHKGLKTTPMLLIC